jgi:hypothetical protein
VKAVSVFKCLSQTTIKENYPQNHRDPRNTVWELLKYTTCNTRCLSGQFGLGGDAYHMTGATGAANCRLSLQANVYHISHWYHQDYVMLSSVWCPETVIPRSIKLSLCECSVDLHVLQNMFTYTYMYVVFCNHVAVLKTNTGGCDSKEIALYVWSM